MRTVEEVTKYIHDIFKLYGLSDYGFFVDTSDETFDVVPVELFKSGQIEDEVIEKVVLHTGFSKDELLDADRSIIDKYLKKFPFFSIYREYRATLDWDENYTARPEEILLNRFFSLDKKKKSYHRYSEKNIEERLVRQLKEINKVVPGTWHKNAEIVNFHWYSNTLTGYSDCSKLLEAFFQTVDYYKILFYKALRTDLQGNESSEFNFLTSALRTEDVITYVDLNSETIKYLRKVYNEEGYKDLLSYVRFNVFNDVEPWRCKSFIDDRELAERYLAFCKGGKKAFIEFVRSVAKISCWYSWSDDIDRINLEQSYIPEDERDYPREELYIDKTPEEMTGWSDAIQKLIDAAASEAKGGLKAPIREFDPYSLLISERTIRALIRNSLARGEQELPSHIVEAIEREKKISEMLSRKHTLANNDNMSSRDYINSDDHVLDGGGDGE